MSRFLFYTASLSIVLGIGLYYFSQSVLATPFAYQAPTLARRAPPVVVNQPARGALVSSPLTVTGLARGSWFFEATFPVELRDATGKRLAQGTAATDEYWMTTGFVPFSATLTFAKPKTETGTLVLSKDNPSGEPQNDARFEVPVKFK